MSVEVSRIKSEISQNQEIRDGILKIDEAWKSRGDSLVGNDWAKKIPGAEMEHHFVNGLYMRKAKAPAGMLFTTQIHKVRHPFFILSGAARILTEEGITTLTAPYQGFTEVGTKRLMYILEDITWYTIHATNKTTVEEVEKEILADGFDEIEFKQEQIIEIQENL